MQVVQATQYPTNKRKIPDKLLETPAWQTKKKKLKKTTNTGNL